MESPIAKKKTLLTLGFNNMITHFTNKAWLVTFEHRTGGFGCCDYGIHGIFNKKNLAEIALEKLNKNIKFNDNITYSIKEVNLNEKQVLFQFLY